MNFAIDEQIVKAIEIIDRKLFAHFPQLENKVEEIHSASGAGVAAALSQYDPYREDHKSMINWLVWAGEKRAIGILRSAAEDLIGQHLRKIKRFQFINESDYFWRYPNTLDCFPERDKGISKELETEIDLFLEDAFQRLSELEKDIFNYFYIEKYSYKEIAEIKDMEEKQVDNALCRVKRKIVNCLRHNREKYPVLFRKF